MKERIVEELKRIEQEQSVKVIYAVEAGSRAWGYHTPTSDYDVRFIYMRQIQSYLSLQKSRDVLEQPSHGKLELSGWDLTKALKLLHHSNPSILEWLTKENVYLEHPMLQKVRDLGKLSFSTKTCMIHYHQMAKRNINIQRKEDNIEVKKYMNILRPWLACEWIVQFHTFPPNNMNVVFKKIMMNEDMRMEVKKILALRKNECNLMPFGFYEKLTGYIENELIKINCSLRKKEDRKNLWATMDETFLTILKEVWRIDFD